MLHKWKVRDLIMDSAQRVNPAPAVYAAAVAVVVAGASFGTLAVQGDEAFTAVFFAALLAVVAATVAVAVLFDIKTDSGTVLGFSSAIGGLIVALNVGLTFGVNAIHYLVVDIPLYPWQNEATLWIWHVVYWTAFAIGIVVAGLASVGAVTAGRRLFGDVSLILIIAGAIAMNTVIVAVAAAFSGSAPDTEYSITLMRSAVVDNGPFYGVKDAIGEGTFIAGMPTTVAVWFGFIAIFFVAGAVRRYDNENIDRIVSLTAIGVAIISAAVAVIIGVASAPAAIAGANDESIRWYGRGLETEPAIVAGMVSILGCAITSGMAGIVAWWYRALRRR